MDDRTTFRRAGVSRRSVLRAGLAGGAVLSMPSLLSACGKPEVTSAEGLQIASPDNPVRWPIHWRPGASLCAMDGSASVAVCCSR